MGQKSAVDRLPENLRTRLREMLQDPAVTQAEIVDAINAESGESLLSRSSMNRYAQRMKRFAEKNRQAKEIADAYIDKYGTDNRVKRGTATFRPMAGVASVTPVPLPRPGKNNMKKMVSLPHRTLTEPEAATSRQKPRPRL
jgi:hypothetical protein